MARNDFTDFEMLNPREISERIRVAWGVLDTMTLPPESKKILNFSMAVVMLMAAEAPDALVILGKDLTERLLAYRATKSDA